MNGRDYELWKIINHAQSIETKKYGLARKRHDLDTVTRTHFHVILSTLNVYFFLLLFFRVSSSKTICFHEAAGDTRIGFKWNCVTDNGNEK